MSILEKAVEIASLLDPSLLRELEVDFGGDWKDKLSGEVAKAEAFAKSQEETDPLKTMSVLELRRHFKGKESQEHAISLGLKLTGGESEKVTCEAIYKHYQNEK